MEIVSPGCSLLRLHHPTHWKAAVLGRETTHSNLTYKSAVPEEQLNWEALDWVPPHRTRPLRKAPPFCRIAIAPTTLGCT